MLRSQEHSHVAGQLGAGRLLSEQGRVGGSWHLRAASLTPAVRARRALLTVQPGLRKPAGTECCDHSRTEAGGGHSLHSDL